MIVDRIWLRLKGELLALKEDIAEGGDVRQQAEEFLDKLEKKFDSFLAQPESESDLSSRLEVVKKRIQEIHESQVSDRRRDQEGIQVGGAPSMEELERAWDDLKRRKSNATDEPKESEPPPPNPRRLG